MSISRTIAVLMDRATAEQRLAQWDAAIRTYDEALRDALQHSDVGAVVEVAIGLGHVFRHSGDVDGAAEQFELALILAELHGFDRLAGRALNSLGILHQERGATDLAEETYLRARACAATVSDKVNLGFIDQNLGALANTKGDLAEALTRYQQSLSAFEELENDRGRALVLNNLGMLYTDLERFEDADNSLQGALVASRAIGDVVTEGIIFTNLTELQIARGNLEDARTTCDSAFEIASRTGYNYSKAETLKFYGIIYRDTGKPHLAEIHLRQAIGIAEKNSIPLTEAEAYRELALVLRTQDRNQEALEALNRSHTLFSELKAQRDQADVDKRVLQLEEDFLALVRTWGESIEAKDRYTSGHCQRVADYACRIAHNAGMSARDLIWFRMGAFLHDVGKTEVPEEILNKPGKLTDEERQLMERHTIIGYEMLSSIEFPWDVLPMVRSHHERWDGRGYPDRLSGDGIPFTARVLRIADVFDALTTTRSYRQPLTAEQAFKIMEDDEGSFDPELFGVFRRLLSDFSRLASDAE